MCAKERRREDQLEAMERALSFTLTVNGAAVSRDHVTAGQLPPGTTLATARRCWVQAAFSGRAPKVGGDIPGGEGAHVADGAEKVED